MMATDYEETLQLAKEAGMFTILGPLSNLLPHELVVLQRFAELVAAKEREACELMHDCEELLAPVGQSAWGEGYQEGWITATCAYRDAIRARNNKENNDE